MHLREIVLEGFMAHQNTRLAFPERGLLVVLGENGAGKSSIIEGPAVGLWGKTLRGADPWNPEAKSWCVDVVTDTVVTRRDRSKKGTVGLVWRKAGVDGFENYATTTKAQQALEALIGAFDVWRRTHVFSSADAAHFSLATDAERKRLLESVLGLGAFDAALSLCRTRMRPVDEEYRGLLQRLDAAKAVLESETGRVEEARAALATVSEKLDDPAALAAKAADLGKMLAQCDSDILRLTQEVTQARDAALVANGEAKAANLRWEVLKKGKCPTCGQAITDAMRDEFKPTLEGAQAATAKAVDAANAVGARVRGELEELQEEKNSLVARRSELVSRGRATEVATRQRDIFAKALEGAEQRLEKHRTVIAQAEEKVAEKLADLKVWRAAELVLGLKGVRAGLLGRTLNGLEAATNAHLARISNNRLTVRLRPYVEKKSGGVTDAIGMALEGAGGGFGYAASSQGERRRVDFALLLALAEVAAAAQGVQPGTLFFDEVFDSLDDGGIEAVASSLVALSESRAVVVVTHVPGIAERLPGRRLRVAAGKVEDY